MAYDRYERGREREWRGQDDDRSRHDHERGGRNEDRGFFERAGDEIASWFGGEDDHGRGRNEQDRMGGDRYKYGGWGGEGERERYRETGGGRDFRRGRGMDENRGGSRPGNWTPADRDYRSGMDRGSPGGGSFGSSRGESGGGYRPMAGDYGRSESSSGFDRSQGSWGAADPRPDRDSDRHYQSWRQQQLDALDRDYDHYCRERQDRFENDFGGWRQSRQQKRQQLGGIREKMDVVGSDGQSIGHVDKVRGDRIVLAKGDSDDNRLHSIDCSMIDSVEAEKVCLSVPAEEAKSRWQDVDDDRGGLFGRGGGQDDGRDEGDVNLERSFSGTYR